MGNVAGGGSGSQKTPREKWHYMVRITGTDNSSSKKTITSDFPLEKLADSANEKDVDTNQFKGYMDEIENEGNTLLKAQEFSDVGNVSIMIDSKNIVETWITDLKADIENDVKKLNDELDSAYSDVVAYHNEKQGEYNKAASEEARKNCTSGEPWCEEIQE